MSSEMIQIAAMAVLARPIVERNLSGWQMAYQRSTEMKVSVRTETDTETVCWNTNQSKHKHKHPCLYLENDSTLHIHS